MPKTPGRKLKVFQARIGFYDTVVAAPSQAAALRAWGIRQNLFASGDAAITADTQAVAAALEYPEQPLRRGVGSGEPFSREPTRLPQIPDAPRKPQPQQAGKPRRPPPAADRSMLEGAETTLRDLDQSRKQEEADERRDEAALAARRAAAQASYVQARKQASAAVVAARQAYRKAGGVD